MSRPERRLNLLTGDWVLVSPQRVSRPWQGAASEAAVPERVVHDPACYLCAGVMRAGGVRNPEYEGVYVFDNDYPALLPGQVEGGSDDPLLVREPEAGLCRVICYTPDHSLTMAGMSPGEIEPVVETWTAQFTELAARADIGAVTIFENRGEMMGASNPHPHGQIWAQQHVPNEQVREGDRQREWFAAHGETLLASYLRRELAAAERIICANETFVALVPFWAAWPFEALVLPRRSVTGMDELTSTERAGLADILSRLTRAYDRLFEVSFPYTMGFHQRPTDGGAHPHVTLHAHFYPPLLRSASVRKFMVGYEMLAMPQRDLTPEEAAARLRDLT
ncbi:MAG: UDP-glucose--hexose-1-phosphate uridylyltransferase [Phenylobacterium sp.]|uniref:UDP-glucose--hexose-1-phosphate uridylyltransferase n=1 Tax=Phenylobacterium sp. TaxID=1871053 RepID=UPI00273110EB|nr:UDP-glucose--hexose-1-phosphate uridylyltransferase [Phenylobacterium sp.]MDP2012049.1 UDP-glucose--hexose-1-phosphate uridylyltransferase [Phenylobacterium sp.]